MRTFATSCFVLSLVAAAALLAGCGASQVPAVTSSSCAAPFAFTHHTTLRYTGKKQTFNVPSCVTRIQVIANGGSGGGITALAHGGRVSAVIPVTPSETLAIYVGGAGTSSGGGFNGGGSGPTASGTGGYGAGGASDVRRGGDALTDRVIVAGGGGGQGNPTQSAHRRGHGGPGGALTGGSGQAGCCKHFINGGAGGIGGTQLQGGPGGPGALGNAPGKSGQLGQGGAGGSGCNPSSGTVSKCGYSGGGGGGGGGGYYGGGGGGGGSWTGSGGPGAGGGGGGGSSYVEKTASEVHLWRGWKNATGNGAVVISW